MSTSFRLLLPAQLYVEMFVQATTEFPYECCGFLAGRLEPDGIGRVVRRYPLLNRAASPVEYDADPKSMFAAVRDMRPHGLDILAIYHSHPTSAPVPSRKDCERNFYGDSVMHLILSLQDAAPILRAWWLTAEGYREAEWEVDGAND